MIVAKQYEDAKFASWHNVGPNDQDCFRTGAFVDLFVKHWGERLEWIDKYYGSPHETNFLKLDCSKLKSTFDWKPHWNLEKAIDAVVEWSKVWIADGDVRPIMNKQR